MFQTIKNIFLSGLVAVIFTIPFQIVALLFVVAFCKCESHLVRRAENL